MVSQVFLSFFLCVFFRFALPLPLVVVGQHQFFTFTSMFPFPLGSLWSWWWRDFRIVVITVAFNWRDIRRPTWRRCRRRRPRPRFAGLWPACGCPLVVGIILEEACQISPRLHVRVGRARFLTAALASQETLHSWDCGVLFKCGVVACRANNSFCILAGVCQQRLDNPVMCAK